MAELPMNGSQQAIDPSKIVGPMANWAGAAVSVALVVGAGVWGYKLLVRDVTGIPVVRAIEGPMREQPADPGGTQAAHQGLAVNDVAAQGGAAAPADRLVLAPAPIDLAAEDAPVSFAQRQVEPISVPEPIVEVAPVTEQATAIEPAPQEPAAEIAVAAATPEALNNEQIRSLVDQLIGDAAPMTEPLAEVQPAAAIVAGGLGTSLRPKLRPAGLKASVTQAASTPAQSSQNASVTTASIDPSAIPSGTRLVQLGAFASPEIAQAEWGKLIAKFPDQLDGKQRVVQKAESGGRTFYRLRAQGFADLSDARRLCSALKAQNADCIPVVTR